MPDHFSRRRLLQLLGAGGVLVAAQPALAQTLGQTTWPIKGADHHPLRIAFYTDVHANQRGDTPTALQRAADAINRQRPDLVLGAGDLVTGNFSSSAGDVRADWDAYMDMHKAIQASVRGDHHVAIGNHDLYGVTPNDGSLPAPDPRSILKQRLDLRQTFYAFDALGYHIMMLDSVGISGDKFEYHGRISPAQLDWIRAELSRIPRGKPVILTLHLPLLTAFFGAKDGMAKGAPLNRIVVNNREVLSLFADHNLVLVLQGHLHISELLRWRGTTFITGGAICGNWWRGAYYGTGEGYNMITLHPDRVEWAYHDYGWHAPPAAK